MRHLVNAAVLCAGLSCLSWAAAAATPETVETKAKVAAKAQAESAKVRSNASHHSQAVRVAEPTFEQLFSTEPTAVRRGVCSLSCATCFGTGPCPPDEFGEPGGYCVSQCF